MKGLIVDDEERNLKFLRTLRKTAGGRDRADLGLTSCKMALEAHGGRIWVENNTEEPGVRFCFEIPL
jgi:K+-sensing histidine kinase KdpD